MPSAPVRAARDVSDKRSSTMERISQLEDQIHAMLLPANETSRLGREGHGLKEDSGQVRAAKLELASLREDLADLNAVYGGNGAARSIEGLVANIENFIRGRSRFELAPNDPPLRKGETLQAAIDARRRRVSELKADLEQVKLAPWPSALTKARARAQLDELAKRGRPDVFALVERFDLISWPLLPKLDVLQPTMVDTSALMAWAMGPVLVAAVEREIDELSDDDKALTAEQRSARMSEILAEILAVERDEEAFIEKSEAQGTSIAASRPRMLIPRAVLGVS